MNTVTITGRFTADPEMKINNDGFRITEGSLGDEPKGGWPLMGQHAPSGWRTHGPTRLTLLVDRARGG